jgi:hypothetical protein
LGKKRCGERNSGRKFWKKWRCGREIRKYVRETIKK